MASAIHSRVGAEPIHCGSRNPAEHRKKIESCAARNPGAWRWCAGVCAAGGGCVRVRGATGERWGSYTGWVRGRQAAQSWLGACAGAHRCTKLARTMESGLGLTDRSGMAKNWEARAAWAGPGGVLRGSGVRGGVRACVSGPDLYRTSRPTSAKFGPFKVVRPTCQAKLYGI